MVEVILPNTKFLIAPYFPIGEDEFVVYVGPQNGVDPDEKLLRYMRGLSRDALHDNRGAPLQETQEKECVFFREITDKAGRKIIFAKKLKSARNLRGEKLGAISTGRFLPKMQKRKHDQNEQTQKRNKKWFL